MGQERWYFWKTDMYSTKTDMLNDASKTRQAERILI